MTHHRFLRSATASAAALLILPLTATAAQAASPTAADDSATVQAGGTVLIDAAVNDALGDMPNDFYISDFPSLGSAWIDNGGVITYDAYDVAGTDVFQYTIEDDDGDVATANVTVTVTPAPEPVTDLQAAGAGSGRVVLTWHNPAGTDGIVVRYGTTVPPSQPTDGTGVPVAGAPESVTADGLTNGTEYTFAVFAKQGSGVADPAYVTMTPFDCPDLTPALDGTGLVTGSSWVACSAAQAHDPASTLSTVLPRTGATQALITTGDRAVAQPPSDGDGEGLSNGTGSRGAYDVSIYKIDIVVPATDRCLLLDYAFASEEYPEFVGSSFNDGFIAQLDQNAWYVDTASSIAATGNFAQLSNGEFISVNSPVFQPSATVHLSPANGTGYDGMSVPLTARTAVTPGPHSIYLSVFDAGDSILDTGVFLDNLRTDASTDCAAGSINPADVRDVGISASAPTVLWPKPVTVKGVVNALSKPAPGVTVDLWQNRAGAVSRVGTVKSDPVGRVSLAVLPDRAATYQWRVVGSSVVSPWLDLTVKPFVSIAAKPARLAVKDQLVVAGVSSPTRAGAPVLLQRRKGKGWVTIKSSTFKAATAKTKGGAPYAFKLTSTASGTFGYRVVVKADSGRLQAITPTRTVRFYAAKVMSVSKSADEYVVVKNTGKVSLNLRQWTLRNQSGKKVLLPAKVLKVGASVRIHTGSGKSNAMNIYLRKPAMFGNAHDRVKLVDNLGHVVSVYAY